MSGEYAGPLTGANRQQKYGLDADLQRRRDAQYDPALEQEAREWLAAVIGKPVEGPFAEALQSGVVLCEYARGVASAIARLTRARARAALAGR